jgi:hypothetical protein
LAQSRHPDRVGECPLSAESGHRNLRASRPLLTQSGHLANRQRDRVGFANGLTRKIAG